MWNIVINMSCAFFCDTGVLYGRCYNLDEHNDDCKSFFSKFPFQNNHYFIPYVVIDELKNHKIKLDRSKKITNLQKQYARTFQQCIDRFTDKMEIFDIESHNEYEDMYEDLLSEFDDILEADGSPNKLNDSEIVAHAVIWSFVTIHEEYTLITVDGTDLVNNEDKFIEIAQQMALKDVSLKIRYLKVLCK